MRQRNMARRDRSRKGATAASKKSRTKRELPSSRKDGKKADRRAEPSRSSSRITGKDAPDGPKGSGSRSSKRGKKEEKMVVEDEEAETDEDELLTAKEVMEKGKATKSAKEENQEKAEVAEEAPVVGRRGKTKGKKKGKKGQAHQQEDPKEKVSGQEKEKGASKAANKSQGGEGGPAETKESAKGGGSKGKNNKRKSAAAGGGLGATTAAKQTAKVPASEAPEAAKVEAALAGAALANVAIPKASELKPDNHPFPIGAVITAFHAIDGQEHFCDIIERAKVSPSGKGPSGVKKAMDATKPEAPKEKVAEDTKGNTTTEKKDADEPKEKKVEDKNKDKEKDEGSKEKDGQPTVKEEVKDNEEKEKAKGKEEVHAKEERKEITKEEHSRDSEEKTVQQVKEEILASKEEEKKEDPIQKKLSSMVETDTPWRYYVHFHEFNRRMDTWLEPDQVLRAPNQAAAHLRELEREVLAAMGSFSEEDRGMKTRNQKRKTADEEIEESAASSHSLTHHDEEHHGLDEAALKEHEEVTKVKNVNTVYLGNTRMETWYFSPFPAEFVPPEESPIDALYFCQFTLRFFRHESELLRWQRRKNLMRHPPGNEIYRHNGIAMFEVDGAHEKIYSENLSYLAKLFLDHKTLYYDTDCFLFYIMCEIDDWGYHPVGYFSKEKYSESGYNLACILTFPAFQKRGFGRFLIEFSYELSILEEKVGSPEKPLSDLGLVSYRSFWASKLLRILHNFKEDSISIIQLSKMTSIMTEDIVYTLQYLGILKYVGGAHILVATPELLADAIKKYPEKEPKVKVNSVHWTAPITPELIKHGRDKFSIHSKRPKEEIDH